MLYPSPIHPALPQGTGVCQRMTRKQHLVETKRPQSKDFILRRTCLTRTFRNSLFNFFLTVSPLKPGLAEVGQEIECGADTEQHRTQCAPRALNNKHK